MKTKLTVLSLLFVLLTMPLFSQERLERVVDRAGLLTFIQKKILIDRLDAIAEAHRFDLVIVTENSIGDTSPMNYADDFFDDNDFGLGNDRDGSLFLIVIETRDYWISTSGRGIDILNRSAFEKLESDALQFLREDNYYTAFSSFLDNWERLLIRGAQGESYTTPGTKGTSYNSFDQWNATLVIIGWIIALITGLIIVHVWKKGMNTAFLQTQADSYVVNGSLAFDTKTDRFLYSTVTKTARPAEERSFASSGGGGFHMGSSGRSHGGGGGKF